MGVINSVMPQSSAVETSVDPTDTACSPRGLTSAEAVLRRQKEGINELPPETSHPLRKLLEKFWAPVPWMLEITIALQLFLGKRDEAGVIALLLCVNAVMGLLQEGRANKALALLRKRLDIQARVMRDGHWQRLPARELVPGDCVHVRMGDIVPADVRLTAGQIQLDQSSLTGESLPVEAAVGGQAYSGSVVTRGEASGEITDIGTHTRFGKTAELVRNAKTVSHLQSVIFGIVKYLVLLDIVLVLVMLAYTLSHGMAWTDVVPFALILLVASVPVALPATFTLATALGSLELAQHGVLVTRLSAIEEAAAMEILASDKTGTITESKLTLAALKPYADMDENTLLRYAALACDEATQDPIDLAIIEYARQRHLLDQPPHRIHFMPFDPQTRRSETVYQDGERTARAVKGAALEVAALSGVQDIAQDIDALAEKGYRVLGVANGTENELHFAGLIALQDPPRADAAAVIAQLQQLGVRVMMVTGDSQPTARHIAQSVGIGNRTCPAQAITEAVVPGGTRFVQGATQGLLNCDVFAQVFPEDKFNLVRALQLNGQVIGMTGDGVNDAPALKQAEVGIAVSSATDVAKASASLVLTNPGLGDVVAAVQTSRRIYQRMLTYTLNKIIKTLEIAVFMSVGVMLTGVFVITPLLIVLLLFTNDFVTMSIATDHVVGASKPERWRIPNLMRTAAPLAAFNLLLSFSVFFFGRDVLHLPLLQLQTLIFVMLVFTGLGNVFLVRERRHFWQSRPSRVLIFSALADVLVVSIFAAQGIWMGAISPLLLLALTGVVMIYLLGLDFVKIRILHGLDTST